MNNRISALHCDLYELTMAQGYWHNAHNPEVVFDMFVRSNPFAGGFTVFVGLDTCIDLLQRFCFSTEDIAYLQSTNYFTTEFLAYLKNFSFSGDIYALREGQIIFPQEPIIRVHAHLIEAQLIEGLLLNTINYQSLIATKTARIYLATQRGTILEFGMRRAHGLDGALSASRAAFIGGASATSHVAAGKAYNIPVSGTMAHSWVMAFDNEEEAFAKFTAVYQDKVILLIDTYNSLGSGIEQAIKIGKRFQKEGRTIGVRLDSGDMQYLSKQVRKKLDDAGLPEVKITISNELDEKIIHQLVSSQAPIDMWGVGSKLITGYPDSSLSGVYKLAAKKSGATYQAVMKVSDNPLKSTNPGIKQLYRFYNANNEPVADLVTLQDEVVDGSKPIVFNHPVLDYRKFTYYPQGAAVPLLQRVVAHGKRTIPPQTLTEIRSFMLNTLSCFDDTYLRIINPHVYKVSISSQLRSIKEQFVSKSLP